MRHRFLLISLMTLAVFILGACEQLAGRQNNKSRIRGDWQMYSGGFMSDSTYSFDEGIIKKDDFAWSTYSFVKHSEIEVSLGDTMTTYMIEFVNDDEMFFYEIIEGERFNRYEWRR